ncbi:MAG: PEP-CTERM sorting domain-containing protein, partial [Chthoniobacterales bacterium]|nr:PEP-CTERM sorting domain-containing protein [Chthoniobacterales bacterium]
GNFNLAVGTLVSAAGPFSSGLFSNSPNFNSSNNYIGFRFQNEAAGQVQYGWAQIFLGATLTDPARAVVGYAYDNTGAPIAVGAIPEPTTTALLGVMAVGAIGLRAWRKRKAA